MNESQWKTIRHFEPSEFDFPDKMNYKLLVMLDSARDVAGVPFKITSDYREGATVDGGGVSAHAGGYGLDLEAHSSRTRYRIVDACLKAGFTRIGVYDAHVHVDVDPDKPTEVMWWGKSK